MGIRHTRPVRRAVVIAALAAATTGTWAGSVAAETSSSSKTKIIKRVVIVEHGRKVTVTTFTKNGKTYKRKQWKTRRKNGKVVYHSYTYLVRGKKAAASTASQVKAEMKRQCAPGSPAAVTSALDAFWAHFQAGHLETSVGQQVADALNVDDYVKLHTVLIENMLNSGVTDASGLPPALQELLAIFEAHFVAAHLNTSPFEQVLQITSDPDGYVKLHTALIANMLAPLQSWAAKYASGTEERCTEVPATAGTATPAAKDVAVDIKDNKFPANIDVATGSKVTWTNQDSVLHTVSSMHGGPLKSGTFEKGKSYSYTFTTAGSYMYVCDVHPDMQGTVTVK
jgi:plastocyanin